MLTESIPQQQENLAEQFLTNLRQDNEFLKLPLNRKSALLSMFFPSLNEMDDREKLEAVQELVQPGLRGTETFTSAKTKEGGVFNFLFGSIFDSETATQLFTGKTRWENLSAQAEREMGQREIPGEFGAGQIAVQAVAAPGRLTARVLQLPIAKALELYIGGNEEDGKRAAGAISGQLAGDLFLSPIALGSFALSGVASLSRAALAPRLLKQAEAMRAVNALRIAAPANPELFNAAVIAYNAASTEVNKLRVAALAATYADRVQAVGGLAIAAPEMIGGFVELARTSGDEGLTRAIVGTGFTALSLWAGGKTRLGGPKLAELIQPAKVRLMLPAANRGLIGVSMGAPKFVRPNPLVPREVVLTTIERIVPNDITVSRIPDGDFAVVMAKTQLGPLSAIIPDSLFRPTVNQVRAGRQLGATAQVIPRSVLDAQEKQIAHRYIRQYLILRDESLDTVNLNELESYTRGLWMVDNFETARVSHAIRQQMNSPIFQEMPIEVRNLYQRELDEMRKLLPDETADALLMLRRDKSGNVIWSSRDNAAMHGGHGADAADEVIRMLEGRD